MTTDTTSRDPDAAAKPARRSRRKAAPAPVTVLTDLALAEWTYASRHATTEAGRDFARRKLEEHRRGE